MSDLSDNDNLSEGSRRQTSSSSRQRKREQEDLSGLFDEDDNSPAGSPANQDEDEVNSADGGANGGGSDVEMEDVEPARGESPRASGDEEEEDDIFGDAASDEDDNGDYNRYGSNTQQEEEEEEMEEVEMQEMEITMPRYLSSHKVPKETAIARIPNFLNIDPVAFDADTYLETAENIEKAKGEGTDESRRQLREEVQNMIRWRYVKDEHGNNKIQSNARIIRWSNGSYSLKLGGEIFDIQETPVNDTYLAVSHNEQEIVQFHNKISKILNMTPSSTTSQTHLRMSNALARGQVKTRYINDIVTIEDPEKVKREAEKAEENKIRARKKLENKRAALESRSNYDRELGAGVGRGAGGGAGGRGNRYDADDDGMGYGNSADYEKDDFVVSDDDEDEEEERAERLRKLKKAGADKYKKRRKGSDDDDEDEEEEEEEEDGDDLLDDDDDDLEIPSQRRDLKRRRDYSDDDDEE